LDQSSDPSSLIAVDPETFETELIFAPQRFDPGSLDNWGEIGGVPQGLLHPGETLHRKFFSEDAAGLQSEIDRALPGNINLIQSTSRDRQRLIILSYNEQVPGHYYLLDRQTGRMMALGSRMDGFNPRSLGQARAFSFSSSDGLTLHGRLILPPASNQPAPVVIMIGNRIFRTRDYTEFSPVMQAFASRGYAVAEVDYRGSKGYGHDFAKRGRGQIQQRIPLDLAEAVVWLGTQGWIDPKRAIIMGEFQGGWVAMHTLVRTSVFACWINYSTGMFHDVSIDPIKPDPTSGKWNDWQEEIEVKLSGIESAPSPMSLLPRITVPSFHYYLEWRGGTLFSGGERVAGFLRRNERDAVMITSKIGDSAIQNRERIRDLYEKIFAFLAERFPTEQNPRPSTVTGQN
jgi:pimeloyl-ACP methyl ester carboxylesterase